MLSKSEMHQIERENAHEARMAGRDWSMVLAALLLIAAIFGFIYMSEYTGTDAANNDIAPAAGSAATAPAPSYDAPPAEIAPGGTTNNTAPSTGY